jgi:hypothetical protein
LSALARQARHSTGTLPAAGRDLAFCFFVHLLPAIERATCGCAAIATAHCPFLSYRPETAVISALTGTAAVFHPACDSFALIETFLVQAALHL